ncbi:MAG: Acetylene hydratase [Syntrophorhabdus sp. PtaU1.Bin058]|nr:MAG: Acetylene hydratase [Syntrophorhabdus sp. PtaU1.Bin058]
MEDKIEMRTICGLCHTGCGMLVTIENGKIAAIRGDKEHPANQGALCPKGVASIDLIYSKDRLLKPMRKTKGGFKEISWQEALDFAADRLGNLREKSGPGALIRFAGAPVSYDGRDSFMQLMASFGSPNFAGVAHLCHVPRITAMKSVFGSPPEPDYAGTKMIIFWGTNPMGSTRYGNYAVEGELGNFRSMIQTARAKGIKVITIDPVKSETGELSDMWVPIEPGTDLALALAMIHVLIEEDLYDSEFVKNWTVGFNELQEHVKRYTPEWAEGITHIPADTIRQIAREYGSTRPAVLRDGNGFDMQTNGAQTMRAVMFLIALTGNYDRPGGNVLFPWARQSFLPDFRKIKFSEKRIGEDRFPLFPEIAGPTLLDEILAEKRRYGLIVTHSNPALIMANTEKIKKAFSKLEFMMVLDMFPTATAQMADLILPSPSLFESYGYRAYSSRQGGFISLKPKLIEPLGDSRHFAKIEYEIASRLGMAGDYAFSNDEEWVNYMLKPTGLTVNDFDGKPVVYATGPADYYKYLKDEFGTPSKKVEFYSDTYAKHGQEPLPSYKEPLALTDWDPQARAQYPLKGTTRKQYEYVHTKFRNLDYLKKLYPGPLVMVHPDDASACRIQEGDMVRVQSPHGSVVMKAKVSDHTKPGLVVADFGWGNPWDASQTNANSLARGDVWDPISGGTPNRLFYCNIRRENP